MPDAFQRCPVRGKAAMAKKMKHLKFHLNTRKNNFTLRVAEQCNRLPGGAWSLLWKHSKPTCCGLSPCHLLQAMGLDDVHRSLPTLIILRFCEQPLLPPASALHLPAAAEAL